MNAVEDKLEQRQSTKRSLRLENMELRKRLEAAEEEAIRYTVMLREGDHRIKNSLQIVSNLMSLQARREASSTARDALKKAAERVGTIARMHDALQVTSGSGCVDIGAILKAMGASLQAMAGDEDRISVIVDIEPMHIPIDTAQPLVLAVNELVINALRHAFPDERKGHVRISLRRLDGGLCVTVADDGVGLPSDYSGGQGYGMKLIRLITKQIGGVLHVSSEAGATLSICAPFALAHS
jgi:two-component sensor histidine kinase